MLARMCVCMRMSMSVRVVFAVQSLTEHDVSVISAGGTLSQAGRKKKASRSKKKDDDMMSFDGRPGNVYGGSFAPRPPHHAYGAAKSSSSLFAGKQLPLR